mmetsp:Transcript_21141/g.2832  ORF Transcript_21141/g.2832 Transcript_21141/m.2832 type:complete len:86 (+) Transcript_21141:467-724(+)
MPEGIAEAIYDVMDKTRISGRLLSENKVLKTDLFNHSHYNLLFQNLNEKTLVYLRKNQKDVNLHEQIFGFNISDESVINDVIIKE